MRLQKTALGFAVDAAAGPIGFVVRRTVGYLAGKSQEAAATFISGRFFEKGYSATQSALGGSGALLITSLVLAGAAAAKGLLATGVIGLAVERFKQIAQQQRPAVLGSRTGGFVAAESGTLDVALEIPKSPQVARIQAMVSRYPEVIDLRTGRPMNFPADIGSKIPKADRVPWGANQRGEFISEWYDRGYATPRGGWSNYDIHHIKPREYGGSNDFWNLAPVARQTHQELNSFWKGFTGL